MEEQLLNNLKQLEGYAPLSQAMQPSTRCELIDWLKVLIAAVRWCRKEPCDDATKRAVLKERQEICSKLKDEHERAGLGKEDDSDCCSRAYKRAPRAATWPPSSVYPGRTK